MAYKGTVFKVKPESLIVATEEFEFMEISRHGNAKPGQEIVFSPEDILHPRKKRLPAVAVASILIILLVATSMVRYFFVSDVYAYVGIDINPSLELAINKYLRVTEAEAGDTEAEKILQSTKIAGLDVSTAVGTVLNACSNLGYINDTTSHILLTTTINSPGKKKYNKTGDLENELFSRARQELQNRRPDVNVYVVKVEPAEREQALSHGVSAGRYFLWNKAREEGADITLEEVKTQSIGETIRHNGHMESILMENAVKKFTAPAKPDKNTPGNQSKNSFHKEHTKEHTEFKKTTGKPQSNNNSRPQVKNVKSAPENNNSRTQVKNVKSAPENVKSIPGNNQQPKRDSGNQPHPGAGDNPRLNNSKSSEVIKITPAGDSRDRKSRPSTPAPHPRDKGNLNEKPPYTGPAASKEAKKKQHEDKDKKTSPRNPVPCQKTGEAAKNGDSRYRLNNSHKPARPGMGPEQQKSHKQKAQPLFLKTT